MNFQPTFLYIKQHAVTSKLYFGKTSKKDPVKYLGSGTYWKNHIKKHGREHVVTLWHCLFTDQEELTKFALMCSEMWNIVKSDQWLNQVLEDGLGGGQGPEHMKKMQAIGRPASVASPKHASKNSEVLKKWQSVGSKAAHDSPNASWKNPEHVKKMVTASAASPNHVSKNPELQKKWREAGSTSPNRISLNPEHQKKWQEAGVNSPNHNSRSKTICPHCGKEGSRLILSRWHFNKCKFKGEECGY